MATSTTPGAPASGQKGAADGDAASQAVSKLFESTAQALSNAVFNAVSSQQQGAIIGQATVTQTVITILGADQGGGREASAKLQSTSAPGGGGAASPPPEPPRPGDAQSLTTAALKAAEEALDPMMSLVTLNVACIAMIDAAQHLQRAEIIAEAAMGLALQKATGGQEADSWKGVIAAAEQSVSSASEHLTLICNAMIAITRNAAGRPQPKG